MSDVTVPSVADTPPAAPVFDPQAAISALAQQGYRVYAKDFQFDPAVQTDDPFVKDIISKTTSKLYSDEDTEIYTQTGIAKNQGEKTYAYRNRAFAQLKEQINAAPDVQKIKTEYETKLADAHKTVAEVALLGAVRGLKLNATPEAMSSMQELLTMRALSLPHRTEGPNVIFQKYADDGQTLIDVNDPTTGRPMAADKYVAEYFKTFLAPVETPAQGSGKTPATADTTKKIPTTKSEIGDELLFEGFVFDSPAFRAELTKRATAYAITQ